MFPFLFCNQKLTNRWKKGVNNLSFQKHYIMPQKSKSEEKLSYNSTNVLHILFCFIIGLFASSRKESFLLEEVAPRLELHFEMLILRRNLINWDKDQRSFKVWNSFVIIVCLNLVLYSLINIVQLKASHDNII